MFLNLKLINISLVLLWVFIYFASINLHEVEYFFRFINLLLIFSIIIIQSDTGVPLTEKWKERNEKFKIMNAMKLPNNCKKDFYETISSINTFRLIFNCIKKEKIPFVKDRYFEYDKNATKVNEIFLN